MSAVRAFIAQSLDGYIAGPNDELDWLETHDGPVEDTFGPFFAQIGALLMGRRTYEIVAGFDGAWPYGDTPVLVATQRPLEASQPTVRLVQGSINQLVEQASEVAGPRDIYIDGGALVRSALDAGLVDTLTVTIMPIVLGCGISFLAGCQRRHKLELEGSRPLGAGIVQLSYLTHS